MKRYWKRKLAALRGHLNDKQRRSDRITLFAKISIIINVVTALGKIGMSIYSLSHFLFVGGLFNGGIGMAKAIAVKWHSDSAKSPDQNHGISPYSLVGLVVMIASISYMAYSFQMIYGGNDNKRYDIITAIGIAAFSFTEIGVAVYGIIKMRRDKEPTLEAIKMTNLVSSFISIVHTQSALLSVENTANAARYCGITGMLFGAISAFVGVYMMARAHQ